MVDNVSYRIYPSLLDKFQEVLHPEKVLEAFWNIDRATGEYKMTQEEIEERATRSLIDSINRVPFHSYAADNGTVFNELIDCLHRGRKPFRNDIKFKSFKDKGVIAAVMENEGYEDEYFLYDLQNTVNMAEFFKGSCCQLMVSAVLPTNLGNVELYGYIDELKADIVYDIKTTQNYHFGHFEDHWQRHVYPYCLIESGKMKDILAFEYSVLTWSKYRINSITEDDDLWNWMDKVTPNYYDKETRKIVDIQKMLSEGRSEEEFNKVYPQFKTPEVHSFNYTPEFYAYNHKESTEKLTEIVESFILFLESHREEITDKKIFNLL